MTRVDLKSDGFDAGSSTVDEDWNDWNKPVISLESAKLLRNRTCTMFYDDGPEEKGKYTYQIGERRVEQDEQAVFLSGTLYTVYT